MKSKPYTIMINITKFLEQLLGKLNQNLVAFLMVFLVLFIIFEGWVILLRKPYMEYHESLSIRKSLTSSSGQLSHQTGRLKLTSLEIKQLSNKLSEELYLSSFDNNMASSLMKSLDYSAGLYNLKLVSLKPNIRKQVSIFEEVSFEVSAKGSYLSLCSWMLDFPQILGSKVTVTEFNMEANEEGKEVTLSLKIALYLPLKNQQDTK